jgi:hypothetical protein
MAEKLITKPLTNTAKSNYTARRPCTNSCDRFGKPSASLAVKDEDDRWVMKVTSSRSFAHRLENLSHQRSTFQKDGQV